MAICISVLFFSCNDSDKIEEEISKIDVQLNVSRFDVEFADAEASTLPVLKKKYPYLFPANYAEGQNTIFMNEYPSTLLKI